MGFCLYAFCSLRDEMGCFFSLLFVCITRHLLNLLLGERRKQAHLCFARHVLGGGGKDLGTLPLPPSRVKPEKASLWTGNPVLPGWKETWAKHPHMWCHGPTPHKPSEFQSLKPKP